MRLPLPLLPLWPLPLLCAGLFLVAIHLSFVLAATSGQAAWCMPYFPDCVSISASGRGLPARLLFKPLLTLAAVMLLAYWWLMERWLRVLGVTGNRPRYMVALGMLGALCLIAYVAGLGEGGASALFLRRLGAVLGFSLSYLAQLLLTGQLHAGKRTLPVSHWLIRLCWWLMLGLLGLGVGSALLELYPLHEHIEDAVEWMLALMLNLHVALTAWLWRATDFQLQLGLK